MQDRGLLSRPDDRLHSFLGPASGDHLRDASGHIGAQQHDSVLSQTLGLHINNIDVIIAGCGLVSFTLMLSQNLTDCPCGKESLCCMRSRSSWRSDWPFPSRIRATFKGERTSVSDARRQATARGMGCIAG